MLEYEIKVKECRMVAAAEPSSSSQSTLLTFPPDFEKRIQDVVDIWKQIPDICNAATLDANLIVPMLRACGFSFPLVKMGSAIVPKLIPDMLVYSDLDRPPILVIESKSRGGNPKLSQVAEADFENACQNLAPQHYRDAVGYSRNQNGIRQYLDNSVVPQRFLASYGFVFNGDFFQLWRRVDGLIFPLTPIQKVTEESLPKLIRQLATCLHSKASALVTTVWNQAGGVAKTTNTINIGATLALKGKRVLLIDLDPQGDLSRGLGIKSEQIVDYLTPCAALIQRGDLEQTANILKNAIRECPFSTFGLIRHRYSVSVLPCERDSLLRFRDDEDDSAFEPNSIFRRLVGLLKADYDYILIDFAPAYDELAGCALMTCDMNLIPVDLGGKALHHAMTVHHTHIPTYRKLRVSKSLGYSPWSLGLVFSNCPIEREASLVLKKAIDEKLREQNFTGKQYKARLNTYVQTKIAEFKGIPVISWQKSPIAKRYTELTNEVFLNPNFIDYLP